MDEKLLSKARLYAAERQLDLTETLGSGKDGIVLVVKHNSNPVSFAVKVLYSKESYAREKAVYKRLEAVGIATVLGFNIPQLLHFNDDLLILEMTIVTRPFVLDFAGARLDVRPDFPEDVWEDWESEKREQFEGRWPTVQEVMAAFENLGIYLLDVSPGNIGFLDETAP